MLHHIVHKYFKNIVTWFRNFNARQIAENGDVAQARRAVGAVADGRRLEDGFIYVIDPKTEEVIQRVRMGEVNHDGTTKKVWIRVTLKPAKAVDKLTR